MQYFGHMRHNLTAPDALNKVVKVINPRTMTFSVCLILSKCCLPDLPLWQEKYFFFFFTYLTLPDCRGSCNPSKISLTIWLLYCDQICLHLTHNKWFWVLPQHYDPVWTHKAQVPESDYVALSFVWLSKPLEWYNTQHVSTPTTMTLSTIGWYMCHKLTCHQNIAKLST